MSAMAPARAAQRGIGGGDRFYAPADTLVAAFVDDLLAKNRSPRTLEAYARDIEHFGAYLTTGSIERDGETPPVYPKLRDASASDIRRYVLHLMQVRRYKVVAVRRNLSALRTFYTYLRRERIRTDQPALDVDLPKPEQRKPKVLRLNEVASMITARVERPNAPHLAARDRAIVELLYGSGLRRAELAGLDLDDVDLGEKIAMVTGKGNKRRMVPLTQAAADAMRSYLTQRPASPDRAFFLSNRNARLGLRQVWQIVKDDAPLVRDALHRRRRRSLDVAETARTREHPDDAGLSRSIDRALAQGVRRRTPARHGGLRHRRAREREERLARHRGHRRIGS
jgi:integrase/recombinase XerC